MAIILNPFQKILLKASQIDLEKEIFPLIFNQNDKSTESFFGGLNFDSYNCELKLMFRVSIKNSILDKVDINKDIIEILTKKNNYLNHIVFSEENQIIFTFGFGEYKNIILKTFEKTDMIVGDILYKYDTNDFEVMKANIEKEKEHVINIENILEEKKEFIEKLQSDYKKAKIENESIDILKLELQNMGLL